MADAPDPFEPRPI
jgi:uncharacterized BrkB/YihY/UPF0761 family membrane protein